MWQGICRTVKDREATQTGGGITWRYHRRSDTHAKQRQRVIACIVPAGQQRSNTKAKQHAACLGPAGRPKKCAPRNTRLRPSEGEGMMVCITRKSRKSGVGYLQLYLLMMRNLLSRNVLRVPIRKRGHRYRERYMQLQINLVR